MKVDVVHHCDVTVDGAEWPVYGWTIDGPFGRIVVDTGMPESTPALDEKWHPVLRPFPDFGDVTAVINTHLHFDHCGGNRLFAGTPTYVQRIELEAAVEPNYVVEWARFPGESYVLVDGDAELFPGVSVVFTPGHSPGHQVVVVEADEGRVVCGGDVTHFMQELVDGSTPATRRVHELGADVVYLAHAREPWRPSA